jgi:DNA (cytosine-5)-methyltransferase 1
MNPDFLVIDLFCGAGGTTTGFEKARIGRNRVAKVIACVNHDEFAIKSHRSNHKSVLHFTEDIRTLELSRLSAHKEKQQKTFPKSKLVLWASLECTNFSRAKGGQPRDADSRTLADHLFRYIEALQPDYVMIENVEEFMCWGPLDENGKPISRHEGTDFIRWVNKVKTYGFDYEHRLLNSADFGAYTSRTRYFAIFAKHGLPIVWPEPTHAKNPQSGGLFSHALRKWKAVREVLDLEDIGKDIFEREKALSEKTLERIYAGLMKYVAGGKAAHDAFVMKMNSGHPASKCSSVETVTGSLTTTCHQYLVQPGFLVKYLSNSPQTGFSVGAGVNVPAPVITAQPRLATVFLSAYHGNGHNCTATDRPAPTVAAADALASVQAHWIDSQFGSGDHNHSSADEPCGSLATVPKKNLVNAFLINHTYNNYGTSVDQPAPTILASRRHQYIVNPSWGGNPGSVDQPCCTIVARQDKSPLYVVTTETGQIAIAVYEGDSPATVKIKQFMALYGIVRITMRMLKVDELKQIMGLPVQYVLAGNQSKQKWMIGNMVHPVVPQHMARALSRTLRNIEKRKAA